MVEYSLNLDTIFSSLADPTRRDILQRLRTKTLTVGEIAQSYNLTLAAISKHLRVLENARLVTKHRQGKQQLVSLEPRAFNDALRYLEIYQRQLSTRMDALEAYVKKETPDK